MISLNYIAIVVVAIVNMVLGSLWYGPIFGKPWKSLMGFTEEKMKQMQERGMGAAYALMGVGSLLIGWVLAEFITSGEAHYHISSASFGLRIAVYLWVGIVAPITVGSVIWEGKPWKLWFLNAGYYLVSLCIMGAILAVWH